MVDASLDDSGGTSIRVLVTGAGGFVGLHVCERLRAAGHAVLGLVRRERAELAALGVVQVQGDLHSPASWSAGLSGITHVIHCAGNPAFGNGPGYQRDNVESTEHLIAVLKRVPSLQRLVMISTIGAVDRARADRCVAALDERSAAHPSSDYGRSKLASEEAVRRSGLPFAIVRLALVVGPDMRFGSHFSVFARHALRAAGFARIAWPGAFSVVHVDDAAAGILTAAFHPDAAGAVFFCAGDPVRLDAFLDDCNPDTARLPLAWAAGAIRTLATVLPFGLKALLLPALVADDRRLRALGWQPSRSGLTALAEVKAREAVRVDADRDPGGQTIVTGAASGLGRAFVERLAPKRQRLLLVDRDAEGLRVLQARYPQARIRVTDLADAAAIRSLVESAEWREWEVAELYLCAGLGVRGAFADAPLERQADTFLVNVIARLRLMHAALPAMRQKQAGRIVLISSSSAFQPLPHMAAYAASNAAVLSLGEGVAAEVAGEGIQILTVCPGGMATNFQSAAGVKRIEGERLMPPEAVVAAAFAAIARGRMTAIVSTRALAMSLLARALPRAVSVRLWKKMMEAMR